MTVVQTDHNHLVNIERRKKGVTKQLMEKYKEESQKKKGII